MESTKENKVNEVTIFTAGESFPEDKLLEQLANQQLLFWSSKRSEPRIESAFRWKDMVYRAATLDSTLEAALRLPSGVAPFGTAAALVRDLEAQLPGEEGARFLLASAILATWVADWLPAPLLVNPWGGAGHEKWLASVLSCLCRRALAIAVPTPAELFALPRGLQPTLILRSKTGRELTSLLAATGRSAAATLNKGRLLKLSCPIVVYTSAPLPVPAVSVPIDATLCRPLTSEAANRLADVFQPRLLDFRLQRHLSVANSQFDVPEFAGETRMLAIILGSVFEGEPELQRRVVEALRPSDEGWKTLHAEADAAVVLETLLVACHEDRPKIFVGELTELVNTLLLARQACKRLSPEAVGHILRDQLGLFGKRSGPGVAVLLDRPYRQRIHQLASVHHTLSTLQPVAGCSLCVPPPSSGVSETSNQSDPLHNLHDPHDLHARRDDGNVHDRHQLQDMPDDNASARAHNSADTLPEGGA
jgi:hypothetical protein